MEQNIKNIFNSFDEHGTMLSLPRLRGEKNKDYKQRILDAGVNRASSSYGGLISGICRELGLAAYNAISINIGTPVEAGYIPMINVDHAKLTLYEDYATDLVDLEIELYDNTKTGNAKTLSDVVDAVNTSTHFTAILLDAAKGYEPSITLIHQDSNVEVYNETAQSSNTFYLDNANVIPGTISFSEIDVFYNRLESYDLSTMNSGEYYVDYDSGKIVVKETGAANWGGEKMQKIVDDLIAE